MLCQVPYFYRLLTLIILMSAIAAYDYHRHKITATKWREYAFVVAAGLLGSIVGLVNDLVTSSVSPEYFIIGKGLPAGAGLHIRAGLLGMKAGFSAGAIAAGVFLYASTRKCCRFAVDCRSFSRFARKPLTVAIFCSVALPLFFSSLDPLDYAGALQGLLVSSQVKRFLIVWWTHSGLYIGLVAGLTWAIAEARRKQKQSA